MVHSSRCGLTALVAASLIAGVPAVATADVYQDSEGWLSLLVQAARVEEPDVVIALMDATVTFDLDAPTCGRKLARPGRARGRDRAALAACLVELGRHGARSRALIPGTRPRARWETDDGTITLELRWVKDRLRITGVRYERHAEIEAGVEGGVEGGMVGGVVGGIVTAPPPPPPPPPAPPQTFAPQAFESQRIAGEKNILPDDDTKDAIAASGRTSFIVPVKVCVKVDGTVADVQIMKSSGFPAYDRKLEREIRRWRYRPFMVNGRASPACSMVNFSYRQS